MLHDQLEAARKAVRRASDNADESDVRNQLQSIDEGLGELDNEKETQPSDTGEQKTKETAASAEGDRLQQVEEKLAGLLDRTDGAAQEEIEEARDAIDTYRQEHTQDW